MSVVDELIQGVKNDSEVGLARFNDKFLCMVGEMCSVYGYGATRLFLLERNEYEAEVLLRVLRMIEEKNLPFEIGKLIFKNLNTIKDFL